MIHLQYIKTSVEYKGKDGCHYSVSFYEQFAHIFKSGICIGSRKYDRFKTYEDNATFLINEFIK